jgi:hypothetical protein
VLVKATLVQQRIDTLANGQPALGVLFGDALLTALLQRQVPAPF